MGEDFERDFDLACIGLSTDIEALRDRIPTALIYEKHLVDALVRRIDELAAKESAA